MRRTFRYFLLVLLSILISASSPFLTTAIKELEIVFLDVGQGDSALIVTPEGKSVLIDGGESEQVVKVFNALNSRRIGTIDVVIATHPHTDHIDGLIDILEAYKVNKILEPGRIVDASVYTSFKNLAQRRGIPIEIAREGMQFSVGSVSFEVLSPSEPLSTDIDDSSVVLLMKYGAFSALFTGDIGIQIEDALLLKDKVSRVTLLKVAHHGSSTSSSEAFLNRIIPQYAVISVGAGNDYGHPSQDVITRLTNIGATVFRTDLQSSIVFKTDGKITSISNEKSGNYVVQVYNPPKFAYVASKKSDVFHYSTCKYVKEIDSTNLMEFETREAAIAAGKHPCSYCKP